MDTLPLLDRDCSAIAGLFQIIVNDLKSNGPMWDDFLTKASKLHQVLKSTIVAFVSFLDSFQRIADSATHTRGATKEVGAALTRLSLRHRAIESRVKSLTSTLMESLLTPLQEKLDEWKRTNHTLDKEHTKEYKRARTDIKKRTENALRLQKKAKKAGKNSDLNKVADKSVRDLVSRYGVLETTERAALRQALLEERSRYCTFALAVKPVLEEEVRLVSELGHLQEVMTQLDKHSSDLHILPPASEQVLEDVKSGDTKWSWQTPPSSPTSSLGSRKSSMCSISSINSSSSSSTHSPSHHPATRPRSVSQGHRMFNGVSQDSGFTSQDTLYKTIPEVSSSIQNSCLSDNSTSDSCHTPSPATQSLATWPNLTDPSLQHKSASTTGLNIHADRPHTISSAYERGKDRPPLTVYTFQPPDARSTGPQSPQISSQPVSPVCYEFEGGRLSPLVSLAATISRRSSRTSLQYALSSSSQESLYAGQKPKPPIPMRCSSLERPLIPDKKPNIRHLQQQQQQQQQQLLLQLQQKGQQELIRQENGHLGLVPDFNKAAPDMILPQPVYSNMSELKNEMISTPNSPAGEMTESDGGSSLGSSGYGSQPNMTIDHTSRLEDSEASKYCTLRPHSLAVFPQSLIFPSQDSCSKGHVASRSGSLRRGQKPPPPVRRTSSITSTSSLATSSYPHTPSVCNNGSSLTNSPSGSSANVSPLYRTDSESSTPVGSMENLPPPPAFLLDDTLVAEGNNDADTTTPEGILFSPESFGPPSQIRDECLQRRAISVSDTVKTLMESRFQPPSPVSLRRASATTTTNASPPQSVIYEPRRGSVDTTRAALISSLNSKLSNQNLGPRQKSPVQQVFPIYAGGQQPNAVSPKLQRLRLSSVREGPPPVASKKMSPPVLSKPQIQFESKIRTTTIQPPQARPKIDNGSAPRSSSPRRAPQSNPFINSLNQVLSQRQSPPDQQPSSPRTKHKKKNGASPSVSRSSSSASEKASKVRQWISSKKVLSTEVNATSLRESLLDQIKKGTPLRRAKYVADRSDPRVY